MLHLKLRHHLKYVMEVICYIYYVSHGGNILKVTSCAGDMLHLKFQGDLLQ